jgi:valyl-tRNA synthetase
MPFVTEVLWTTLTGGESVVIAEWPTPSGAPADPTAAQQIDDLQKLITEVRRFRSDQGLNPGQRVAATVEGLDALGLDTLRGQLDSLARLETAGDDFAATATVEVRLSGGTATVAIDTSGTVDIEAERKRAAKDLAAAEKELAGTTGKLGNEQFLSKAPDAVVDKIKARQALAQEDIARLKAKLEALGA